MVAENACLDLQGVGDGEAHTIRFQQARVADLAARLRIERGGVQHDHGALAGLHFLHLGAVHVQGGDLDVVQLQLFIAFEARVGAFVAEAFGHLELAGGASLVALAFHGDLEAGHVDLDFAFAADVGGQVNRETVGVVQREQRVAVQHSALGHIGQGRVQDAHAVFQRFAETLFFSCLSTWATRSAMAASSG